MAYEQESVRALYRKLLALYPRTFREQLGESMEQTFNDLINEREQQGEQGLYGYMLWLFVETALGVIGQHLLLIKAKVTMKTIASDSQLAAIISLLIVVPFMTLEWVNRQNINEGFPIPLFIVMWFVPALFLLILTPIVRTVRAGNTLMANPVSLLLKVAFLVFLAWLWGTLVVDQMPCFVGVPNCD
jgi:uncharacterized membrane protein